ncbi:hypothetical protein [Pseudarthrobacter sulfonivorans]|uniref:hypothetical protein n=1 Tax=Pseudarthrobacter sulfonivorans TaxID=121292 RepID=UPI00285A2515|nr:hypothetical protein [Pseudarthrobacter sulfonivorans]MDR6413463.1 hypothetical protein [Pseudarthrobacter sulfonivorans]
MHAVILPSIAMKVVALTMKLSDDDSFLTWSELVIPSLAGLASFSVAVVSVVIAWQARNIAERSETARVEAEDHRLRFEQQLRFDSALKDLYVGVSERIEALRAHDAAVRANMFNINRGGPGINVPSRPPISSLLALIAAARLDAHENEATELLDAVGAYAAAVAQAGGPSPDPESVDERQRRIEREVDSWEDLLTSVNDWRHSGTDSRVTILAEMLAAAS